MPFEIAIHPTSLRVRCSTKLLEGQSTEEYEEIPFIVPANDPNALGPTNYILQTDQSAVVRFKIKTKGLFTRLSGLR